MIKSKLLYLVDNNEQYGRHIIESFINKIIRIENACDIGVGYGNDMQILSKKFPESKLYGIDFTENNKSILEEKNISLYSLNIEKDPLPFPGNHLDLIIANQIIEHIKEIFWVFHQITSKLRTGGYLLVGIPNICAFHNRVLFLAGHQPSQMKADSAHVRGFAPKELPRFIERCFPGGYDIVQIAAAQFYPFPPRLSRLLCSLAPNLGHSMFYLFKKRKEYHSQFLDFPASNNLETNFFTGNRM